MAKRDLTKIIIDEVYSKSPNRCFETNKIIYNHINEIWIIELAYFSDYKTLNIKRFGYIFIIIDTFSK